MFDEQELRKKIKRLSEAAWEGRAKNVEVDAWLDSFSGDTSAAAPISDRVHMLYLLSNFVYFGVTEVRELLRTLFRSLCERPLIADIRHHSNDTVDVDFIDQELRSRIRRTRFLAVGNPSESGQHLLYYFRQENKLPSELFPNYFELPGFAGASAAHGSGSVDRYVFIDDLCGSGTQVIDFAAQVVDPLAKNYPTAEIAYLPLFATQTAMDDVRAQTKFTRVEPVMQLDSSFKCFAIDSRIYADPVIRARAERICTYYGRVLYPRHPLGYRDGQLALGFSHNTPDNTLPVFWVESNPNFPRWVPIFRRYHKA